MRRFLPVLLLLLVVAPLGACSSTVWGPVLPVVDPVQPQPRPVDPAIEKVVPYATVQAVTPGLERAALETLVGFPPMLDTPQDDKTRILRWPALGPTGANRWLDVQLDAAGKVLGHVLWPRVP